MKNNLNKQRRKNSVRVEYAKELARLIDQSFDGMRHSDLMVNLNMFMGVFAEDSVLMKELISLRNEYRLREMFERDKEERKRVAKQKAVLRPEVRVNIDNFLNTGGTFNNIETK